MRYSGCPAAAGTAAAAAQPPAQLWGTHLGRAASSACLAAAHSAAARPAARRAPPPAACAGRSTRQETRAPTSPRSAPPIGRDGAGARAGGQTGVPTTGSTAGQQLPARPERWGESGDADACEEWRADACRLQQGPCTDAAACGRSAAGAAQASLRPPPPAVAQTGAGLAAGRFVKRIPSPWTPCTVLKAWHGTSRRWGLHKQPRLALLRGGSVWLTSSMVPSRSTLVLSPCTVPYRCAPVSHRRPPPSLCGTNPLPAQRRQAKPSSPGGAGLSIRQRTFYRSRGSHGGWGPGGPRSAANHDVYAQCSKGCASGQGPMLSKPASRQADPPLPSPACCARADPGLTESGCKNTPSPRFTTLPARPRPQAPFSPALCSRRGAGGRTSGAPATPRSPLPPPRRRRPSQAAREPAWGSSPASRLGWRRSTSSCSLLQDSERGSWGQHQEPRRRQGSRRRQAACRRCSRPIDGMPRS